jgi:hypothetical protein
LRKSPLGSANMVAKRKRKEKRKKEEKDKLLSVLFV